jgi:ATP-binding cassette subfamily C (CFTR/MRP) protein 10
MYGIRAIKLNAWEPLFAQRVSVLRAAEVRSLAARKYLDALCVFFWATTPVLISILTFMTYVLMGHQLTAAKVVHFSIVHFILSKSSFWSCAKDIGKESYEDC